MPYDYDARVRSALLDHGLRATPGTPPALARAFVNDLYRYQLRRLREALLAKRIARRDYAGHVVALRRRYWLLSVPLGQWTTGTRG